MDFFIWSRTKSFCGF